MNVQGARLRRALVLPGYGYLLLALGLFVLLAVWALSTPAAYELMVIEVEIPKHEREYGFRGGWLQLSADDGKGGQAYGIKSVDAGGRLARLGFLAGDVPIAHHGDGLAWFCHALERAEAGETAELLVLNVQEPPGSARRHRRVTVGKGQRP
jgi:hypothetical protein